MEHFGNKLSGFANFHFLYPASVVSVLGDRHIMHHHHKYDICVIMCDIIRAKNNMLCFKIVYNIKKSHFFE